MAKSSNFKLPDGIALVTATMIALSSHPGYAQDGYNNAAQELESTFAQLLSSLGIKARQISTDSNQLGTVALKTSEAFASAVTSTMSRLSSLDSVNDSVLGRDQSAAACNVTDMRELAYQARERERGLSEIIGEVQSDWIEENRDAAATGRELNIARQQYYCSDEEFEAGLCAQLVGKAYNTGASAGNSNAGVFMDGGALGPEEAATGYDFIDHVAPLPTMDEAVDIESSVRRRLALRKTAEISMARTLLSGSVMGGLQ